MRLKSLKWLEDIRQSSKFILDTTRDKTFSEHESDPILRAAVERHFEIIGEAVNRLAKQDRDTAEQIPDFPRIIAFKNTLIHGYNLIDNLEVWSVIQEDLVHLLDKANEIMGPMR